MNKKEQYMLGALALAVIGILVSKTPTSTQSLMGLDKIGAWFVNMGSLSKFFLFAGIALFLVVVLAYGGSTK